VFDGHYGPEVARFCEKYFAEELLRNKNFEKMDYSKALEETFMKMDELLFSEAGKIEVQAMKEICDA
jgi:hypothetical protein